MDTDNVISAQEIKRRGIRAVDEALNRGPVHVISRNRPRYVILSEEAYQRLVHREQAERRLWERLLSDAPAGTRDKKDIDRQVDDERASWDTK